MNKDELAYLQTIDPVKKQAEVDASDRGGQHSPMSPPEAHSPPCNVKVNYQDMHPFLKQFIDEHNELKAKMDSFQVVLRDLSLNQNVIGTTDKTIKTFFHEFMKEFTLHNQREEKILFPVLGQRFLQIGEHSRTNNPITPIDVMEDEHKEAFKVVTECVCIWDLVQKVFDPPSQAILIRTFIRKSNTLLEMMRLHIYREDDIVFSLAQRHLTAEELDGMLNRK